MTYVSNIVAKFGGTRPMAAKIGRPVSTVDSWKARGSIPDQHKPLVLDAARRHGLEICEADFFPAPATEPTEGDAA